jgi:tetratricopeptide (TPR) repeat protein
MLEFLKKIFKRKTFLSPDAIVEERYEARFDAGERRFRAEREGRYSVEMDSGALVLAVPGPRVLAWALDPVYRYRDVIMECDFRFGEDAAPSRPGAGVRMAAGFLLRFADDGDFYSVMVGDSGHLRFDIVFNGTPRAIIPWTETGSDCSRGFSLRAIARGTRFSFLVNDRWVAEAEDDGLDLGWAAIAAENYSAERGMAATCSDLVLESRPVEVEALNAQFGSRAFIPRGARATLAETLLATGRALPAAIQMEKIAAERPLIPPELLLRAEARLRLGLLEEAEADIDAVIAAEPGDAVARSEKANVLYLRGSFPELRDWIDSGACGKSAMALNLLGHARHNLGDYPGAARAYLEASEADPTQAMYALNAARSLDAGGERDEAAKAYLRAASLLLEADELDDMALVLDRLAELAPGSPETIAVRAKLLYREGRASEAAGLFDGLIASGEADASAHYLSALIRLGEGKADEALPLLRRSVELEGSYPPYRLRLAERLFLSGLPYREELDAALAAFPDDGWILNLAAQAAIAEGRPESARALIEKALSVLPGEVEPVITFSELLSVDVAGPDGNAAPGPGAAEADAEASANAALAALAPWKDSPRARNQAGNILSRAGRLEEALSAYRDAIALEPGDPDVLENRAACLIELERYAEAEADLRRAMDARPGGRAYFLMGRIAEAYGDFSRAEVAFRAALEESPRDARLLSSLAELYLSTRRFEKAEPVIARLEAAGAPEAARARERLVDLTHDRISCASCGREWLSPRDLPPVGPLRLSGELPDESPAGACPECGKVFCVGCRKDDLEGERLVCPDCRAPLRLSAEGLKRLAMKISGIE